jgi:hypothetical protein
VNKFYPLEHEEWQTVRANAATVGEFVCEMCDRAWQKKEGIG